MPAFPPKIILNDFYFLCVFVNHMKYAALNFTLQYASFCMQCQAKWTCKQERDYTLGRSLSNVIWSISFHRDPMSIRKKKSWLIYFIQFIHGSQTASHTFLLLLKSAGKRSKIPLHGISVSICYSSQNLKQLLFLKSVAVWCSQNVGTIQLFGSIE